MLRNHSMQTYLVRLQSNQELVGLFVSPRMDQLWEFVDECCDPFICEFVRLPPGGIYQDHSGAARVPTNERFPVDQDAIPDWFAGATISELWLGAFYDESNWAPIKPSADAIIMS